MDYSKTVNLPKTQFSMKANLPLREPAFIEKWEKDKIYEKINDKNKGKEAFILHDGPPYANGHIHLGTALNKILKDIVVKYKSMSGFFAPYTPGWDCHGLPIEQHVMKQLKKNKHSIERSEFNNKAREFVNKFVSIQKSEFKRLGVLGDWENPYLTLKPAYESVIIKTFGELVGGGYVYRQKKPVYWCATCETALADAEVEYADHSSPSIAVKFDVLSLPKTLAEIDLSKTPLKVLIWTTTPWTLPANVALAFQKEADYVAAEIELSEGKKENIICAKQLLPVILEKSGINNHKILVEFTGDKIEGIKCKNPILERESTGILADFVSLEDGTGVVHIAPGHGNDDYIAGLKYKLPIISPVDDRGRFTVDAGELAGLNVFEANEPIIAQLKSKGRILFVENISHSYPHCWRCKKPIIFRATEQWFISIEHENLRKRMFEEIKNVKWIPHYGEKRIAGMIESRPDWCLSRQRLWGVPIPVVYCEKCNEPLLDYNVIEKVSSAFRKDGSAVWFEKDIRDIVGPELTLECKKCKGTVFRKENDILDVWFDSGVSHEAVLRSGDYPHLKWPADLYLEGSDQHRGWFQTSLIPAVALRKKPPYKAVLTHGFVVDGNGRKMSKSVGNVISPEQIIKQYGADIIRLWVSASDYREDIRISPEILKGLVDLYRKVRNTLRFLLGNLNEFDPKKDKQDYEKLRDIDKYALNRLQEVAGEVENAYNTYEFHRAAVSINNYCAVDLSGFYLDTLKDILYCDKKDSNSRKSAQSVLWDIANTVVRLLAPILSFTSEEVWQELKEFDNTLEESVFLASFPKSNSNYKFSDKDKTFWSRLLSLREKALMALEEMRMNKVIGSNMDGSLKILYVESDKDLFKDKGLLYTVLGTWDVVLREEAETERHNLPEETSVYANGKSKYNKCARCWRLEETVIEPEMLCSRCKDAVNSAVEA